MHNDALTIPAEQLWSAPQAAAFLNIGRNAIYEMAKTGELPNIRIGSRIRFIPAELRGWVARQRASTAEVVSIDRTPN
jgi:excisionase family DNA binding protein